MRNKFLLGVAAVALIAPASAMAQETTSTIRGAVTAGGQPVANATVLVTNTANGAKTQAVTSTDGRFSFPGLQPGGPYTLVVTSAQGNKTVTDIFTVNQQPFEVPVDLSANETGNAVNGTATSTPTDASSQDVVVTASSISRAGITSTGPQTVLDQRDISKVASVNRDVRQLERRDPLAQLDLSNGTYGAVSFGGVNPRFNRFTIDGVTVGDTFGLNADASPTGRGPVPYDAIDSLSTSFAPYDFRQTGFTGGAIDVLLRSGSNSFHGTGFYSESTSGIQGKQIGSNIVTVPSYNSKTYGATLSGPIIKDKLFFMVSGERNTDPRPLSPNNIAGVPNLTGAQVSTVTSEAQSLYGYNAGTVLQLTQNKDEKYVGKIDWNIVDGQRLSLTYINAFDQSDSLQNTSTSTSSPALGLSSDAYRLSEVLHAGIAQLNSDWTSNFSTEGRFIYKTTKRGQDSELGLGFAQFQVCTDPTSALTASGGANTSTITACSTGSPRIAFGPDISRQTNTLSFKTYEGSFLTRLRLDGHELKILADYTRNSTVNNFLQYSAGGYYFDNLADYAAKNADSLTIGQALNGSPTGAQAQFSYGEFAFGIQDDWQVNDSLLVTYGVRETLFAQSSSPVLNPFFEQRYGYPNTKTYKGLTEFEPRIGFNYRVTNRLRFHGGFGIFAGGNPDIYLSNSFSNTILSNRVTFTRANNAAGCIANAGTVTAAICQAALNNVNGAAVNPLVANYVTTNTGALVSSTTNALSPNFQLPSSYKGTLSADYKVGGLTLGLDYIYTKVRNAIIFTDARSVVIGTLPDGRPRYGSTTTFNDTNSDIILSDTSKGFSHIGVVRANYDFPFGLSFGASYTRQEVKDTAAATSSVALSNYGNQAVTDPNFPGYGTSSDETKWRVTYSVGFDHAFFRDYRTAIQLFGDTRAGRPYSFTMQDNTGTRSPVFGTISNNDRYLLYVPTSTTDPLVSYDTAATQAAVDSLINSTDLKKYRGSIVPKNTEFNRAFTRIDLHLEQEIPTFIGKSRISIFGDIENLPNLLNHNWGGLRQLGFPYTGSVVNVQCLAVATPTGTAAVADTNSSQACAQYRYSAERAPNTAAVSLNNSLYLIRIGARVKF
ncbi:carboxypeptidase regulatory-like domain-containing protein [uncultured Sphingomonas sp.]|uniref:TonB-dependent receptor n=1 Tax=uncultured Sphingomonas sp. TaxID=158754 RepID=UPI0035CB9F1D